MSQIKRKKESNNKKATGYKFDKYKSAIQFKQKMYNDQI